MHRLSRVLYLFCLLAVPGLFSQEFRSTLTGKVTDPSGAVVPTIKVIAIKSDTNSRFETVTSTDGLYTIPFLPPGPYEIRVEAAGFKVYSQSGITVGSDERIAQNITLVVGS